MTAPCDKLVPSAQSSVQAEITNYWKITDTNDNDDDVGTTTEGADPLVI